MKKETFIQSGDGDERAYRLAYLIAGYIRETLTQQENQELDDWVTANMDNQRLFEELTDEKNLEKWLAWKEQARTEQVLKEVKGRLKFTGEATLSKLRFRWQYAAVACLLVGIGITFFIIQKNRHLKQRSPTEIAVMADLAPGANRAILTLADGSSIVLDSTKKGTFVNQGNVQVVADSGQVQYQLKEAAPGPAVVTYNTLRTPRGGQYQVVLPDGTKAWLNAASSLKYPTSFMGTARKVELSGEGYFEVADNPNRPFSVQAEGVTILVLGTHFNINTYPENETIQVTLAQGVVKVMPPGSGSPQTAQLLRPGQQAQVDRTGSGLKVTPANLQTTLAWKDGLFTFQDTPLEDVLGQVSRWYDVQIGNQTTEAAHFNASIPRNVPVSKLLHLLEQTGQVHFRIDPNRITVTN